MHETTTTARIFADGNFNIIIVETKDTYEYWLQHINYGKAEMQFGLQKKDITYEEFKTMIENDLEEDEENYLVYANIEEKVYANIEEKLWNRFFEEETL